MQSHAYVERIEDGIVVLELRLTPTDFVPQNEEEPKRWLRFLNEKEEKSRRRFRYPTKRVEIPVSEIAKVIPDVKAMDVIVVEHVEGTIQKVCYFDQEQTKQRLERAEARRERLREKVRQTKQV